MFRRQRKQKKTNRPNVAGSEGEYQHRVCHAVAGACNVSLVRFRELGAGERVRIAISMASYKRVEDPEDIYKFRYLAGSSIRESLWVEIDPFMNLDLLQYLP
jgi:hypothetical protein